MSPQFLGRSLKGPVKYNETLLPRADLGCLVVNEHLGAFVGLKVIELGRFIAVPYCAQLLADSGADVIKIEPIEGDQTRRNGTIIPGEGIQYLNKNRGKRSVAVNLKNTKVNSAIKTLCEQADVIIANFRPGVAESLGLDYETLRKKNTRLIYAENTGYGLEGPLAKNPAMDAAIQAFSGLADLGPDGPSLRPDPIIDYMAAMLLSWGIASALYHREKTDIGQRIDVALLQAALVLQNNNAHHIDVIADWRTEYVSFLEEAYKDSDPWSGMIERKAELLPHVVTGAYYGFLQTSNGVIVISAGADALQRKVATLLNINDPRVTDPDWEPPTDIKAYQLDIRNQVQSILLTNTTEHWLKIFNKAGVPCQRYQTLEELIDHPQTKENDFMVHLEHELLGGMDVVAPPVKFSETPLAVQGPSPVLGKHTKEVLLEAGMATELFEKLVASGDAISFS
jgi:formyl-CoA transferase